ncbi:hypothetical protein PQJ75_28060 [Rhodoplanes sp. TEM]|uniref:Serine protease n=1 Tax=Rhodoplanes tepidamans TaxID=200616 RepID=A0ABT5JLI5_RHOTP|nr:MULTISPECIES: hypothetical protein [Rhodoplanes]MDC7789740.1 hypothetical protein [Rhodoplanes tepidamans]MDC7987606.1 hypothetical protein [Rhodoplanes sp. TEM]MDQ0358881.1 hypothetical protein [Rhodoplanes tepidamans]
MSKQPRDSSSPEELPDPAQPRAGGDGGPVEFDPDAPGGGPGADVDVAEADETVDTLSVGDDWFAAQEELESRLGGVESFAAALSSEVGDYTTSAERPVGTGIGFRVVGGLVTSEPVLKIYVTEKVTGGAISTFSAAPSNVGGMAVEVEEVGSIVPQLYNRRYARPVRCGVSIGHPLVTAGTLGCLVVTRNNHLCLLSNNHVMANSNNARVGDPIIQPGRADGGVSPGDRIAVLENFVRINFPGPNLVDAAVAWTSFAYVDPRHVTYTLNPTPLAARLGMTVKKNGRTTQSTVGTVTDISVNISVGYPGGVAQFRNQIGIRGVGGPFSRGGDSGSLIVTANSSQPVALLFAGRTDNSITFANPIAAVMSALGIVRFLNRR